VNGEVKFLTFASTLCWGIFTWAFIDMLMGNPTAIEGVVSLGILGIPFTVGAVALHRLDKPSVAGARPDYQKIADLEHELGITQAPPPPGVLRRVERDGETTEFRSWGS
jgi:hypothetical protein